MPPVQFPGTTSVLTGPRQAGKTTLLQHLFGGSHRYASLEIADVRAAALADPRSLLESYAPPVIFDVVRYAPELLRYIKERIDANRGLSGQYLLAGSQNLLLAEKVTESLAGRAAILRLFPLSRREAEGCPRLSLPWEDGREEPSRSPTAFAELWESYLRGAIRSLPGTPDRDLSLWYGSWRPPS